MKKSSRSRLCRQRMADADALRETIHEIKTPLNAIIGFAEIIDGQYLGPAHRNYRHRAAEIVSQARMLLAAIEDLDFAARLQGQPAEKGASTDLAEILPPLGRGMGQSRTIPRCPLADRDFAGLAALRIGARIGAAIAGPPAWCSSGISAGRPAGRRRCARGQEDSDHFGDAARIDPSVERSTDHGSSLPGRGRGGRIAPWLGLYAPTGPRARPACSRQPSPDARRFSAHSACIEEISGAGGPGRTRTYNQAVMSGQLYH